MAWHKNLGAGFHKTAYCMAETSKPLTCSVRFNYSLSGNQSSAKSREYRQVSETLQSHANTTYATGE